MIYIDTLVFLNCLEYGTVFGSLISFTGRKVRIFEGRFWILTCVIHLSTNHHEESKMHAAQSLPSRSSKMLSDFKWTFL